MINIPSQIEEFLESNYTIHQKAFQKKETVDQVRHIAKVMLFEIIKPYYETINIIVHNNMFNFLVEPLKNANFYGSKNDLDIIKFGVLISPRGIVASYCDEGNYFKREDVKKCWESKTRHPERVQRANKELGFGFGTQYVYDHSEIIIVDITTGTLYTGFTTNHMIFGTNPQ